MITTNELQAELKRIKDLPKFQRMMDFASILTAYFQDKGIEPIVVGGLAVEIYTRNDYHTHDIDFVSDGWQLFNDVLLEIGFTRTEREWYHREAEIAIEVPSNYLDGNMDKVIKLLLPNERHIYVIAIEDIIIHRIEGVAFSKSYPKEDEDFEWAYRMFLIHIDTIDNDYLIQEAKRANIYPLIESWFS
ncbi:hypothetical protein WMZ97_11490 [Lentibacillus sp. N15]|uniref:hypothetical protein n=1 Tax=Lentibacillus songyuanensis TaxID=3136161 RepID=UPI0031BA32AE